METEVKMLSDIHKNADMGQDTLRHVLEVSRDGKFSDVIRKQMEEYGEAFRKSGEMLKERQIQPKGEAPALSKMMAHININRKSMQDMPTSRLAEMVIQGSTMGVTELSRQIHDYAGEDREVLDFARKQLKREEQNSEQLKKFL